MPNSIGFSKDYWRKQFSLGNILTIVSMVSMLLVALNRFDNRMIELENKVENNREDVKEVKAEVDTYNMELINNRLTNIETTIGKIADHLNIIY